MYRALGIRRLLQLVAVLLTLAALVVLTISLNRNRYPPSGLSILYRMSISAESTHQDPQTTIQDPLPVLSLGRPDLTVPSWNQASKKLHRQYGLDYPPPLFISFTRNWPLLLQAVLSYITAGWPPEQIFVVENTGVQRSNQLGQLSLQNPFFMNYTQLHQIGVGIIPTPVLLTFAQVQNFFLTIAQEEDWQYFFWSHMDVLALSFEEGKSEITPARDDAGYRSLYTICLQTLADALKQKTPWASRFFSYDHLTLVNRDAYADVGGWDTMIPYYMTDCDMYGRLQMAGWTFENAEAGYIYDVADVLTDLEMLFQTRQNIGTPEEDPVSPDKSSRKDDPEGDVEVTPRKPMALPDSGDRFRRLKREAENLSRLKHINAGPLGRNSWQQLQNGGSGEPYAYSSRGFSEAIDVLTDAGRNIFRRKWNYNECDLSRTDLDLGDQWPMEVPDSRSRKFDTSWYVVVILIVGLLLRKCFRLYKRCARMPIIPYLEWLGTYTRKQRTFGPG